MKLEAPIAAIVRLGAIGLFISVALTAAWCCCQAIAGNPPADPSSIAAWAKAKEMWIALSNEFLFFGCFALLPGVIALGILLWKSQPILTTLGCMVMAMAAITLSTINMVLGRLVYPVFAIALSGDTLAFTTSLYYGGLHAADLMWVVCVPLLGIAMFRAGWGIWILPISIVVAITQFLIAYPWFFSAWEGALLRLPLLVWLAGIGLVLLWRLKVEKSAGE